MSQLSQNIKVLSVHELESIFCTKDLFIAIAKHQGKSNPETLYTDFIFESKKFFREKNIEKHKVILERVKQKTEQQLMGALNSLYTEENETTLLTKYLDSLKVENWKFVPRENFENEKNNIDKILTDNQNVDDFLKIFPGKSLLARVVKSLGFNSNDDYLNLVITALNDNSRDGSLTNLKKEITPALKKYLPNL